MPRLPGWAWLLLAIGFATLATYMAMGYLKRQAAVQPPKTKTSLVVVAKSAIDPASRVSREQLKTEVWHQEKPPQGSFSTLEQVEERVAATLIMPGDLVLENKLAPKGTLPGITALLSPNYRAMTVKVDEASGVAGFLIPGNRVDVVVVANKGEYNKDPLAKLLFQNLKVLGTGQKLETRPGDKPQIVPTVTLEVAPAQGERLALAAQEGNISLVLRGQGDQQLVETLGADASKLFGRPRTAIPPALPVAATVSPAVRTVEMIRGLERASVTPQ
ncbi:MAG: Flp pilus assembly protein CpaB [Proteobacteria bacterium]|nr:Flp pilus assembly protein CpaB [Pseudomonadota bacterium]MCG2771297.1 Flp pilus assembly protein CpaB [Desulfobacterales bacterium]